jgi:hypothetical protein
MPDEVKDGAFADGEDMQGFAPVEVAGAVGQPTQQALSPGTAFFAPLSSSNQEILMQRLETAEKRLEEAEKMLQAAAKNLQVAHEELLEFQALASEMFGEE